MKKFNKPFLVAYLHIFRVLKKLFAHFIELSIVPQVFVSYHNECSLWLLKYPFKSAPNSNLNEQLAEQVRT